MRKIPTAVWALVLITTANSVQAESSTKARAILDKAIQATGGEATLAKVKGISTKGRGTNFSGEEKSTFTDEDTVAGFDHFRNLTNSSGKDGKHIYLTIIQGDKGWTRTDAEAVEDMDKKEIADVKGGAYLTWITTLVPLTAKDFTLTLEEEAKVGDRLAAVLKVSHKDFAEVKMFFDKDNGLLIKTERVAGRVKDKDEVEEMFLDDFQEVQGSKQAMKFSWKINGKLTGEMEIVELKLLDTIDDSLFAKP